MKVKKCNGCLVEKPVEDFYLNKIGSKGQPRYKSRCKICINKKNLDNYYNETEERRKRRREKNSQSHLLRKFGLTSSEFSAMILEQNNKCKTCGCELHKPQVDHNHKTGKVRGLLCKPCNMSMGLLKENTQTLYNMIYYINADISQD